MKKDRVVIVFVLSLTLFLTSFVFGYQLMSKKVYDNIGKKEKIDIDFSNYSDIQIIKEDTKISPNTFIEERINYKECGHIIIKTNKAEKEVINMTENEYRDYIITNYPNKKIISYSTSKIVLSESRDHRCPNHYIVGEAEGYLAIYKIGENGEKELEKKFSDRPISVLPIIDQEELKKGIPVDSKEELSDVLENFIS